MKDTLSRLLGTQTVTLDVTKTEAFIALAAEFETFKVDANALVESYTSQVEDLTQRVADLASANETLIAALTEAKAAAVTEAEKAAAAVKAARQEKLVFAIGEVNAAGVLEASKDMSDEQFDKLLAVFGITATVEAKSVMFTEAGVEGAAPAAAVESEEMKLIRQKYPTGAQA